MEQGRWSAVEVGSPQGATVSPLLANIYLHYVLGLWVHQWLIVSDLGNRGLSLDQLLRPADQSSFLVLLALRRRREGRGCDGRAARKARISTGGLESKIEANLRTRGVKLASLRALRERKGRSHCRCDEQHGKNS